MRCFLGVCVVLASVLALGVRAAVPDEPPPPAEAQRLDDLDEQRVAILRGMLGSKDARIVAWGAYEAARRGVKAVVPKLLERATHADEHAQRSVRAALVDLEARAPRALLRTLSKMRGFAAETAVILAVRTGSDGDLLALWDEPRTGVPNDAEIALGNALANRRAAGYARRLLDILRWPLHLYVQDGNRRGGFRSARGSVAGDGVIRVPAGYPPTVLHRLGARAASGRMVLAPGIRPVYLARVEYTKRTIGFGSTLGRYTWQDACRDWLAMLLRRMEWHEADVPPLESVANLRWSTPDAFAAWARREYAAIHDRYWALVGRLIERGALTNAEAAARMPAIDVHVKDKRKTPGDLPKLDLKPPANPYKQD